MDLKEEMSKISTDIQERLKIVENELSACPTGALKQENHQGKETLIRSETIDGRRKRKSLSIEKDKRLIEGLIRRRLLEQEREVLLNNDKAIGETLPKLMEYSVTDALDAIRKNVSLLTNEMTERALRSDEENSWASEPYEISAFRPEEKCHTTSRGIKMRSKSEVLIAEQLYAAGIPFRYEQVLHLGDRMLVPDFTIRRSDGKLFYWEHEGRTDLKKYIERQRHKAILYAEEGIVPWDNYIVTYDDVHGNIDIRTVEAEINIRLKL